MKFKPAFKLTLEVEADLKAGRLKVLPGQWVDAGRPHKSRVEKVTSTDIHLVHGTSFAEINERFALRAKMNRDVKPIKSDNSGYTWVGA